MYQAGIPVSAAFTGVEATGRDSAWAVGVRLRGVSTYTGAFAARWNGKRWRLVTLPVRNFLPETVAASSPADVWIFGFVIRPAGQPNSAGMVLHLVGQHWRRVHLPPQPPNTWNQGTAMQALVFGPRDVWLSGGAQTSTAGTLQTQIWRWSGTRWSSTELPGLLRTLSGNSISDMWATSTARDSGGGAARLYRFVSPGWSRQPAPSLIEANVAVHSPADVWLTGFTNRQHSGRTASPAAWPAFPVRRPPGQ